MLSKLNHVKFGVRGAFALRCASNRRILSPSPLNPPHECSILSQQRKYSQRMFYHNPEAYATGARRQQYLREQQKTTKYQPLKYASGVALSKRTVIPSITTHQRHLGRMQILLNAPRPSSEPATSNGVDILSSRAYSTDLVREKLFAPVARPAKKTKRKVTVVGCGNVGMAVVFSILAQNISNEVCIIDANEKLVDSESKDLQQGSVFLRDATIVGNTDYKASADSAVCVITAGARQKPGQTRLELLDTNMKILNQIIPQLVKYSPDTILVMVSNPCDILTYGAWTISGLPKERVFSTGTHLDTARFRYFIAQRLGVAPSSVLAYIIGEHGDSSVAVWSAVSVGGIRFTDLSKCVGSEGDTDKWGEVHKRVVKAAYEVIAGKGYTNWAIGLAAASVVSTILDNKNEIVTCSVSAKGQQGIENDVFLSLPVVLGANGITSYIKLTLSESEQEGLCKSAEIIDKAIKSVGGKNKEKK
ncbi:L-lactate dehydrogenase [Zeugodacus cucurbitae]|uniref:L-lactate dehydrogenase n=1 Tax=Zeugodacus cucurbitae TaxID=28588 RepID=A0A0A1WTY6_ZEUCU|nr:L-lactate dehydrogenase [Zeugodacus cucurbitae]